MADNGARFGDPAAAFRSPSAAATPQLRKLPLLVARVLTIVIVWFCVVPMLTVASGSAPASAAPDESRSTSAYWLGASDGGVFNYGDAGMYGSEGGKPLNRPIVGMAATPDGNGYWLVASDGGVFNYGDAAFTGSAGALPLNKPIVGMAATPTATATGSWPATVASSTTGTRDSLVPPAPCPSTNPSSASPPPRRQRVLARGQRRWRLQLRRRGFYGSAGDQPLNKPIVGIAATPDGNGYWLVASDGGVFNYGDAAFTGSAGALPLNKPIVGIAATPDGNGYWLVASDGGVFNYGDAAFTGSAGALPLNKPIVGIAAPSVSGAKTSPPRGNSGQGTPGGSPPLAFPAITIQKTANPATVTAAGQRVTDTFTVRNTGNVTLTGVGVSDTESGPSLGSSLGPITCTTGTNTSITLAPAATDSCSATYTVSQADMDNGSTTDTGKVTGTPPSGPAVTATSSATVNATQSPALSVTTTPNPTTVTAAGQSVTYTFGLKNTGNVNLTGVGVSDARTSPSLGSSLGPITCTTGTNTSITLAPGVTDNCSATYTVSQADMTNGTIKDVATATGTPPSGPAVTATSSATVNATQSPALSVTTTPNPTTVTAAGQTVTYTFGLKNTGNVNLTGVGVSDARTSPSLGSSLGPITCTTGTNTSITLAPGVTDNCSATYTVSQADMTNGTIKDVATATGTPPSGPAVTATSSATVTAAVQPDISIQTTPNPTTVTAAGQTVTYTFSLKNTGNMTLTGVGVSDARTSPSLGSSLGPITCTTGTNTSITLAVASTDSCSATYTVSQADMDNGTIKDVATATGTPPSGPAVTATSSATVTATQSPTLSVTTTPNPTTVTAAGQTVTYTFGLKNTGNVTLTGVGVSDARTSPSLGSNLGPITCTTGTNTSITLAVASTDSCSATYTVSQADMNNGSIGDTGKATGTPPSGPAVTATSSSTVTPLASPAITIQKTANPATVTAAGQRVTDTFTVRNTGNVTLTGVGVSDTESGPSLGSSLGPITCTTGTNTSITLAPAATDSCSATYTVSQADMDNGSTTDTGKVTGTPPSGPAVTATSSATVNATQSPALSVTTTPNPTTVTAAGQSVTYTFGLKNTGNVNLTGVGVSDARTSPSLGSSLGPITCTTGTNTSITLAPGVTDNCSATYTVSQADMTNGTIKDVATATGTPPSGPAVTATSSATVNATQSPALSVTTTPNPTTVTAAGQTVTYTFGLKNTGNVNLTGVGVSDARTSPSLGSSLGPITCTTGTNTSITLAPGVTDNCSATYTVSQADMTNGTIKDVATATGTPPSGPAVTATSSATVTANSTQSGGMSAPAGYTNQQLIFDDQFSGTNLDTTKWNTYLGAEGGVWNNRGSLPSPYSGNNMPGSNDMSMYAPSQVSVNNGLTLTAQRNTNQYSGTYPWLSGVITTEGKFSLPTGGWYVQVKAKMPDQSQGMWPAIWFLCGPSCPNDNELDGYEGGWLMSNPNQIMHSDYFADQGQQQNAYNVGADVTAGYHVYGFQFIPGQSITAFFDGRQVWQVQASSGITITGEPYEIILELQVAAQQTSGWHTVTTGSTPTSSMSVAEVQAYS